MNALIAIYSTIFILTFMIAGMNEVCSYSPERNIWDVTAYAILWPLSLIKSIIQQIKNETN